MAKTARGKSPARPNIPTHILDQLPENHLLLYAHLWEFETWLREMVYLELVARYGQDWALKIEGDPQRAHARDSRLRHMPTREKFSTSYILFSQLRRTISRRWVLFREYLPPKDIWDARLDEVEQIRNRVAHFRRGHPDDIRRVQQLLRDIDHGFWRFCTSYNYAHPIISRKTDPIVREFAALDPFPWTEVKPNTYARIGIAPRDLVMAVTVEFLRRPWVKAQHRSSVVGRYGYLYDVWMVARDSRSFDYGRFLENTKRLHNELCHICLDTFENSIRITIPCVAGASAILAVLKRLVDDARNALRPGRSANLRLGPELAASSRTIDNLALQWPEQVLGPSNPLTFLGPDMPCRFFGAA